jgi:hypothetical protein
MYLQPPRGEFVTKSEQKQNLLRLPEIQARTHNARALSYRNRSTCSAIHGKPH